MAILITRIIAKQTQFSEARYWELWSEAHASPVRVFEDELVDAHWLEGEAKKLRDFMLRMSEGQEKTLDAPVVIEAVQDGKYYQVARVVKGPPVSPEEQDWIDEMASRIRQQVAEIQSAQQARIDALESELADKQRRIDGLVAMIQTQQARITALESEAGQATAENLPAESPAESVAEDEEDGAWSAAKLFHPVDPALADEDADDVPVPPRPSVDEAEMPTPEIRTERLMHPHKPQVILCYEANMDLTPDPEYLEVLSTFIEACKGSQYVAYLESDLSKFRVYRLFRAGMLERSVETFDKMRPSVAGELWHCQHTEPQAETPEQDKPSAEENREPRTERLMHPNRAHVVLCYEANMNLTPSPKVLEVLSAFIDACQAGQYINYSQAGLPQAQIDHLYLAGMLECSPAASYKLRPSAAGELWHRQHTTSPAEAPRQEIVIDSSKVEQIRKESGEIRDILSEDDADSEQDEQAQEDGFADREADDEAVADIPDELTDHIDLVSIIGACQSDTARLMAMMMKNDWACTLDNLESAFKGEFVSVIMEGINERAYEAIGDSLIFEEDDRWIIDEGYRDEIEHILNHPDYRRQIADSLPKERSLDESASYADLWMAFAEQLQQYQREAVAVILGGIYVERSLYAIAMREYISIDDIIYQINELAEEYLGDGLIGNDGFLTPIIAKEAQQKLKYVLWGINREMNEDEDGEEDT